MVSAAAVSGAGVVAAVASDAEVVPAAGVVLLWMAVLDEPVVGEAAPAESVVVPVDAAPGDGSAADGTGLGVAVLFEPGLGTAAVEASVTSVAIGGVAGCSAGMAVGELTVSMAGPGGAGGE